MQERSVAHPTPEASRERMTRGMLLFNRERERIHRLYGDTWAVPSSRGGYWRVNLADPSCGCRDFRYRCVDEAGASIMGCKHIAAATVARSKQPHACTDGCVYIGHEEDGEEVIEAVPCRRCR